VSDDRKKRTRLIQAGGEIRNISLIRILPGSDVVESIAVVCKEEGIDAGIVVSCLGTLQKASLLFVVPSRNKVGATYGEPLKLEGPLEFLGAQGAVGREEDGEIFVHLHGLMCDKHGAVHGGHLVKGESPVLITCEVSVIPAEGVSLVRRMDPEVGWKVLYPQKEE
jgi:predicted DNA-binding protein with PD1-like motif